MEGKGNGMNGKSAEAAAKARAAREMVKLRGNQRQAKMGARLGVGQRSVVRYENELIGPPAAILRLARCLDRESPGWKHEGND